MRSNSMKMPQRMVTPMYESDGGSFSEDGQLRVGDIVPDFCAQTTHGKLRFHSHIRGKWAVLISHPSAFTPVCTSEIGALAAYHRTFEARGFKVLALSCDSVEDTLKWLDDVASFSGHKITFPIIADTSRDVSVQLGMIDRTLKDVCREPVTARMLFIVGPDMKIKTMQAYPSYVGRSFEEIFRVCSALQLTFSTRVNTPASWPKNHANVFVDGKCMQGCVVVPPKMKLSEIERLFPDRVELEMPSGDPYMRMVTAPLDSKPKSKWQSCGGFIHRLCGGASCNTIDAQRLEDEAAFPLYETPCIARTVNLSPTEQPASGMKAFAASYFSSTDGFLRLGDKMPDFDAKTTRGNMNFHRWIQGKWAVLFSYPCAFSPVSTTEIGTLAIMHTALRSKGFQVAALSGDSVESAHRWCKDVSAHFDNEVRVSFPIICDETHEISKKLGMTDRSSHEAKALVTARMIFIVDPDLKIKMIQSYPISVGRDIHELVRVCDALQLSDRQSVAIPANWPYNDPGHVANGRSLTGAVFILDSVTDEDAASYFEDAVDIEVPSRVNYLRMTTLTSSNRMPICTNCIAMYTNVSKT